MPRRSCCGLWNRSRTCEAASGPGRLCRAMQIDRRLNGHDLTGGELVLAEPAEPPEPLKSRPGPVSVLTMPASGPRSRSASSSSATDSFRDAEPTEEKSPCGLDSSARQDTGRPMPRLSAGSRPDARGGRPRRTRGDDRHVRPCPRPDGEHAPLRRCPRDARDRAARRGAGLRAVRPHPDWAKILPGARARGHGREAAGHGSSHARRAFPHRPEDEDRARPHAHDAWRQGAGRRAAGRARR